MALFSYSGEPPVLVQYRAFHVGYSKSFGRLLDIFGGTNVYSGHFKALQCSAKHSVTLIDFPFVPLDRKSQFHVSPVQ